MDYIIRKPSLDDIEILSQLFSDLTAHYVSSEDVENRLKMVEHSPIDEIYVYEKDCKVLGVMSFRIRENIEEASCYGEVSVLVVDAKHRGKGVGKKLMAFAEDLAIKKGCIGTWLVSGFGSEEPAHEFYKSLGYKINGYRFVKSFGK